MKPTRTLGGFTLVELMVTLAILAVILGFGIPSFRYLVLSNTRSELANRYLGAFAYARSQAVNTRKIVGICPLNSSNECHDNWDRPVSVFPDDNRDGHPDSDEVWSLLAGTKEGFSVHSRTAGTGSFHFGMDGMVYGGTGSLVICPNEVSTAQMTYIAVSRGGRARSVTDDDGDGIITLSWGGKIVCP
ncbi:GspH/FimT family pseudopilin [Marinobacter oulmenensis]|uniref:Type II secretion system protein H n=1 Tax=Marinobacter oulmenensis TaxID=643747 RepID=A0A840UAJ9_9GAMM|nr:GspH/FimT family pseudopilin [Marinobacter oulmenensis]MBB5322159.1 type IV fimbrial biogenesis protein FimT [Marinobacter oulmenensis]